MSLAGLLDKMQTQKILVVGDVMLDEYIFGSVDRISPEAPVMVVRQQGSSALPGGAANVAKNVRAFGAQVHLLGIVGQDEGARLLRDALDESGLESTLVPETGRPTTRKTRIVAESKHQVLRVDHEVADELSDATANTMLEAMEEHLPTCSAMIMSDYLKGCISQRIAHVGYQMAKAAWKPLIVNPKPKSLASYRGATLISLNRSEASEAWGREVNMDNALQAAAEMREIHRAEALVVTLGSDGMAVAGPESFIVPAHRVEVADPAGAGDTVIATLGLGVAATGFAREVFELAAHAAASVVRHVGVATVTDEDLATLRNES